jgi:hypothetical protein
MAEILAQVLQQEESEVLAAVELVLEAAVLRAHAASKSPVMNRAIVWSCYH